MARAVPEGDSFIWVEIAGPVYPDRSLANSIELTMTWVLRTRIQGYRVKRTSACGGCLGGNRRRRTRKPAKNLGELAMEL